MRDDPAPRMSGGAEFAFIPKRKDSQSWAEKGRNRSGSGLFVSAG